MQRGRLKNIANKSKELNKPKVVRDPFDEFKKSLPNQIDDSYRLKAAWEAYGKPKNYKEALWYGLIQPIDETNYKLPSIGYNEETDEYEYLNKGKENETVAKDIRVWDNDVIPLVKELKLGGYVRTFNEEKDCWTYTKNSQKENTLDQNQVNIQKEPSGGIIDSFQKGGKPKSYQEWVKTVPQDRLSDNYDLETAYQYLPIEELEKWRTATPEQLKDESYHLRSVAPYGNGDYIFLKKGREWINPEVNGELQQYHLGKTGLQFSHDLIFDEDQNRYFYKQKKGFNPQAFKQGGQMNVIPEGALHARKNNMEGAGEDFTAKGIPVVDNQGEQQAEIECNEIIFRKQVTDKMEELYKKYNSEESQPKKDEIAIEMGKILTCEITKHTDDKTGLIEQIQEKI